MAIYLYDCPVHGQFEEMRSITRFSRAIACPQCKKRSRLVIVAPAKHRVDFTAGWNGGAGRYFDTKRERDTWMREKNVEFG